MNSFAIRGEEQLSSVLERQGEGGRNIVLAEDGTNAWTTTSTAGRVETYLELVGDKNESAATLGAIIDALSCARLPKKSVFNVSRFREQIFA